MIEFFSIIFLFSGLIVASYYDLKTTEIPDKFAYFLLVLSVLLFFLYHLNLRDLETFKKSLVSSLLVSGLAFLMYFFGHWGLGDSFLLSSASFSFFYSPLKKTFINPQIDYLFNVFIVGVFYILLYTFLISFRNKYVKKSLKEKLKKEGKKIFLFSVFLFVNFSLLSLILLSKILISLVLIPTIFTVGIIVLWIYLKTCEKLFIKKVSVKKLKIGDVLLESKRWDGIDRNTIKEIKKKGKKYVYVKSGIAFAPVFLISLILTVFFGNLYLMIIKSLYFLL
ncbi:MAG: prepilin peptidase [Candidatus Aenigmatarchaeota archaeon]